MNREYGKIKEDGRLTYAPSVIWIGDSCICNPQEPDYNQVGWFKVFDEKPSEKVGVYFIPSGWEYVMRDGRKVIVRRYREEPIVAPPVVYVVEEIIYNLIAVGKLQAVKAVVGDYWELLTMRERIDATNEMWGEVYPQVCAGLIAAGVFADQSEIDALMAKCREDYEDEEVR